MRFNPPGIVWSQQQHKEKEKPVMKETFPMKRSFYFFELFKLRLTQVYLTFLNVLIVFFLFFSAVFVVIVSEVC